MSPDNANLYFNIGVAEAALENYTAAIEAFGNALRIDPAFELAYLYRATTKSLMQDYPGATGDFAKCLDINPKNSQAYLSRGAMKLDQGDKTGACIDFNAALALGDQRAVDVIKENCKSR